MKTLEIWLEASRDILTKYGFELSDKEIGDSIGQFSKYYATLGISNPEKFTDEVCALALKRLPIADLQPDALPVLEHLRKSGRKLALVTTSSRESILPAIKRFNLESLFDVIISGSDVTRHKPHPEPLEKALTALKGIKDQAIMIGDT